MHGSASSTSTTRAGPALRGADAATTATMEWVAWYNTERVHSYCGNVPPAGYVETFHRPVAGTTAATENRPI
ncbi:transposase InsO family protein [Thermocatellispora tengchongensis]|uniref:Transposase InsO family protein n=1 Tax=Thermocatellispora tengchongensis TaxID=1073253 RepID=A0A840PR12_9ACTN|nr:transposase InsO family protein [Thermocatellispora tengchongensis]